MQTFENTRPYSQPLSPIAVDGDGFAVPQDFVVGLSFLKPFMQRRGNLIEQWVHLLNGRLYVITNRLIVDFELGETNLPNLSFGVGVIRILEAMASPPFEAAREPDALHFFWLDGQTLRVPRGFMDDTSTPPDSYERMAAEAFERFYRIGETTAISKECRKETRLHDDGKLDKDIYLDGEGIFSRLSSDGKSWTTEQRTTFACNAERVMRFDRKAFLAMIKVADEVDFSTSPVCFTHPHGRGMLIERTLGLDVPDTEWVV